MSGLRDGMLWIAAVGIALVAAWRLRRGRRVLLVGRLSPRLLRMVAVALIALGVSPAGADEADPAACGTLPATSLELKEAGAPLDARLTGELPEHLTTSRDALTALLQARQSRRGAWARSKRAIEALERATGDAVTAARSEATMALSTLDAGGIARPPLNAMAQAWTEAAVDRSAPSTPRDLVSVLDATEAAGVYDGWVVGALFRRSGPAAGAELKAAEAPALAGLYGRLEQHARVDDAVIRALAVAGPIEQRPWMSKAAQPRELMGQPHLVAPEALVPELKKAYPQATAGAWRTGATVRLRVKSAPDGAALLRRGASLKLTDGALVVFGRLDVIAVPAGGGALVLEHAQLGALTVPADRAVTAWNLPNLLGDAGKKEVSRWIQEAAACDRAAQRSIEQALPATHAALRIAAARDTKGAPAMRLILALFER